MPDWSFAHIGLEQAGNDRPPLSRRAQVEIAKALKGSPEGFSGYGPARYFRAAQVRKLSEELRRPEVESEAAARFDPARMSRLQIYPGWRAGEQDKEWLMNAFQRLRDFYLSAAAQGRAVVTCLV